MRQVVDGIRADQYPSEPEARRLARRPLADEIRALLDGTDLPHLLQMAEVSPGHAILAASLVKYLAHRPDVAAWLQARWSEGDLELRCYLFWRLLEDPQLPPEWHHHLLDFALENWEAFSAIESEYCDPSVDPLSDVFIQIGDPRVPETKWWAYLLSYLARRRSSDDPRTVQGVFALAPTMRDPFGREAVAILRRRFLPV